jgi:hypothetical protein
LLNFLQPTLVPPNTRADETTGVIKLGAGGMLTSDQLIFQNFMAVVDKMMMTFLSVSTP